MAMEHSPENASGSMHDMAHINDMSSDQAKMEIMLLKIAIDAVDAYNHLCEDHHIEIVSSSGASVADEVSTAVESQRASSHVESSSADTEENDEHIADEEAMAVLSEALEETQQTFQTNEEDYEDDGNQSEVTAEMISDMIGGNNQTTEAASGDVLEAQQQADLTEQSSNESVQATEQPVQEAAVEAEATVQTEIEPAEAQLDSPVEEAIQTSSSDVEEQVQDVLMEQEPSQESTTIQTATNVDAAQNIVTDEANATPANNESDGENHENV